MNLNKKISKKYDDSQNIELEIIDSYKQLLGT